MKDSANSAAPPTLSISEVLSKWVVGLIGLLLMFLAQFIYVGYSVARLWSKDVLIAVLIELGAVLLAIAVIHLVNERVLRSHYERVVLNAVKATLEANLRGYSDTVSAGIVQYHATLPTSELNRIFSQSRCIKIVKTFLQEDIEHCLRKAIENSAEVELFLGDPDSPLLRQRCQAIGLPQDEGKRKVVYTVERMYELICLAGVTKPSIMITTYKGWPGAPLILCDDRIFLGLYLRGAGARSFARPWIEIKRDSAFGVSLVRQFNSFGQGDVTACLSTRSDFEDWLRKHDPPYALKTG